MSVGIELMLINKTLLLLPFFLPFLFRLETQEVVGAVLLDSPPVAAVVVVLLSWVAEVLSPSVTAVVTAVVVVVMLEVVGAVLLDSPPVAAVVVVLLSWVAEVISPSVTAVVTAVLVVVVLLIANKYENCSQCQLVLMELMLINKTLLLLPFFFPLLMR